MNSPLVVFDLDGTLVDTAPDLVATLNAILAREGLPPVDYDAARNFVGGGARLMVERGFLAAGRNLPAAALDGYTRDFVEHYAGHIADSSVPFPGVEAALDTLAERGYRFAVCTNKIEKLSVLLLDALDLSKRFAVICGADTFGVIKPDPEILHRTIARAGAAGDGAVMVGDFDHRHRHRPGGEHPRHRRRFWVHGYPRRHAGARPDHQPVRGPPGSGPRPGRRAWPLILADS